MAALCSVQHFSNLNVPPLSVTIITFYRPHLVTEAIGSIHGGCLGNYWNGLPLSSAHWEILQLVTSPANHSCSHSGLRTRKRQDVKALEGNNLLSVAGPPSYSFCPSAAMGGGMGMSEKLNIFWSGQQSAAPFSCLLWQREIWWC